MVMEAIIMNRIVELNNIEIYEFCKLNIATNEKKFYKNCSDYKKIEGFYFKDEITFFSLYSYKKKLIMYFKDIEYPLHKDLHINLELADPWRIFSIEEYGIQIRYHKSKYLGLDVWSENEDVDLFYRIKKYYKDDEFYQKYTTNR